MATLMTYSGPVAADAAVTRTGGLPLVPDGFEWPECATCSGPMQFLAQVWLRDVPPGAGAGEVEHAVLALFMCQNDPGLCEEWSPEEGGNRALLYGCERLTPASPPEEGVTVLPEVCGVACLPVEGDYEEAVDRWAAAEKRGQRDVLGQLGGTPVWLQHDEAPTCPSCEQPMSFLAQLEQGRDHRTEMNFGGGCGYAYGCTACARGSFLWQC